MSDLKVDQSRGILSGIRTGIMVRAKSNDRWVSVDIGVLDSTSLLLWLRSRGGENEWAENVVGTLLGHDCIHPKINIPSA